MKWTLRVFLVLITFPVFSCSKNKEVATPTNFELAQKHVWILDSFYSIVNSTKWGTEINTDTSVRATFTPTSYTLRPSPSLAILNYNAEYVNPDRVYYWLPFNQKDSTFYFRILSVDDKKLSTSQIFSQYETRYIFYHAK